MLSLRRFEDQAKLSVAASAASLILCLMLIPMVFKDFQGDSLMIYYSPDTLRMPVILGVGGLAGLLGCCGFGLGYNSAGQRRNERQGLSWLGFFLGATAICISILLLAIFWFWKESMVPT